jgi:hypothetical protein
LCDRLRRFWDVPRRRRRRDHSVPYRAQALRASCGFGDCEFLCGNAAKVRSRAAELIASAYLSFDAATPATL